MPSTETGSESPAMTFSADAAENSDLLITPEDAVRRVMARQ